MKKIGLLFVLALLMAPASFAQDERVVEFGGFFDYMRPNIVNDGGLNLNNDRTNFYGIGGRFGVNVHPNVGVEAEASYFFRRSTGDPTNLGTDPGTRIVPALIGLKFHNNGPLRVYATVKGGLVNFGVKDDIGVGGVINSFDDSTTRGAFYPGAGIELGSGFLGLRFEVGDLIHWRDGTQHNLRINVGPTFRF